MGNRDLSQAKKNPKDEFYTSLDVIEQEMVHYRTHFKDKTIFLNCDDPKWSNFWIHFAGLFSFYGLKKLIATHFRYDGSPSYKMEISQIPGGKAGQMALLPLTGNGDFRSEECIELLKESDIVITNPPFSLWREYLALLMDYEKDFLIIGNVNAITYKEVFPLMKDNKLWLGPSISSGDREFKVPDDYPLKAAGYRVDMNGNKYIRVKGVRWYTNLEHKQRHKPLILTKFYEGNEELYPKYDNYDAIEIGYTSNIPMDYMGVMGVPITFMDKYSPDQFEILGSDNYEGMLPTKKYGKKKRVVDGVIKKYNTGTLGPTIRYDDFGKGTFFDVGYPVKSTYKRIFIRNKNPISKKEMLGF